MTVSAALYAFSGVLSATLVIVGVVEILTGRTRWPNGRGVTNVAAHGWMLIATAGYGAGLVVVGLLDRPYWTPAVVVGCAAISACSAIAYRRPRAAPPPARWTAPPDPVTVEELFRRHDDRDR